MQDVTKKPELPSQGHTIVLQATPPGVSVARLLWTRRRFLLRVSLAGLILGNLIAFLTPKQYQSSTGLMPPDSAMGGPLATMTTIANMTGVPAQAADLLPMKSTGALFIGILRSHTVEDRLIDRFHLETVYRTHLRVDARSKLVENTEITEDRREGIITVTVTDGDPKRAAAMARAYVEELDRLVVELNTSAAHRERVFIEEQLKQNKLDLDEASRQLSEFSSKNATLDIKDQAHAMVEAAATLQGQIIAAESELKGLQQIYTDENVRIRAARARIAELHAQLQKLGGIGGNLRSNSAQADQPPYPSLRKLPLLGVTYADLYRHTRTEEVAYETLAKEYELAKVQEAKEIPSVRVLDPAEVPERKTSPHRLNIMLVSTFLAFAFGAVCVVGHSVWSRVDANDPTKLLLQEIFSEVKPHAAFWTGNGFSNQIMSTKLWKHARACDGEKPPPAQH